MKEGRSTFLMLNYNTATERMVIQQNEQLLDLVNPEAIDTVYLHDLGFVAFGETFYEVLVKGPVSFYYEHKSILLPPGIPAGYGTTTETSAGHYITGVSVPASYQNLKLPDGYVVKASPVFWVRVNNKMSDFLNERQLLKIFPEKADQIKKFIKDSKLKIDKREDLIKIGNFCNELMK
jgi:hypothetical protein